MKMLDLILLGACLLVKTQRSFGDELSEITSHNLTGPNVCKKIISTNVSEVVVEIEPYQLTKMVWCAQIPPKCKKTEIRLRRVEKLIHRMVDEIIRECCEGFVENEREVGCIPSCRLECQNGKCIEPWCATKVSSGAIANMPTLRLFVITSKQMFNLMILRQHNKANSHS